MTVAGLRDRIQLRRSAKERVVRRSDSAPEMRPYVWITPARQGGAPCIGESRVPATQVANLIRHGTPIDEAASDYAVSRDDAICAMWWFMDSPRSDRRTKQGRWLHAAYRYLADPSRNPDPGEWPR